MYHSSPALRLTGKRPPWLVSSLEPYVVGEGGRSGMRQSGIHTTNVHLRYGFYLLMRIHIVCCLCTPLCHYDLYPFYTAPTTAVASTVQCLPSSSGFHVANTTPSHLSVSIRLSLCLMITCGAAMCIHISSIDQLLYHHHLSQCCI